MRFISLNPTLSNDHDRASVLVIYTGGTLGMVYDLPTGQLVPFQFEQLLDRVPELRRLDFPITLVTLPDILDSSNMQPSVWVQLVNIIEENYERFDSFVILHGTDTMAYTASALSFMLDGLTKPVILTGAQLPIGVARTDARENLITALEIAAARHHDRPAVAEVCVYFNSLLLRGNRAKKQESVHFNAFQSSNYPHLAMAGVSIDYNRPFIFVPPPGTALRPETTISTDVTILKLFPGITEDVVRAILSIPGLRGAVLETYGAGNAPTAEWFLSALHDAIARDIVLFNVSQCEGGRVTHGQYQTSNRLGPLGVVSGADITTEAAITKLMFLLGQHQDPARVKTELARSLRGEMSA